MMREASKATSLHLIRNQRSFAEKEQKFRERREREMSLVDYASSSDDDVSAEEEEQQEEHEEEEEDEPQQLPNPNPHNQ